MLESVLELKLSEILGPAVAAASARVAVSSVVANARWKEREHSEAARDDFQRTVRALVDLRQERERVRRQLGDEWGLSRYAATRVALNEKRELLIAKARLLLQKYRIDVSDIGYVVVAGVIDEAGRPAEALPFYRRAVALAATPFTKAMAQRPYGRALILSGERDAGRRTLLEAADALGRLSTQPGLDADAMRAERADTLRALIWAQINAGQEPAPEDFPALAEAIATVREASHRRPWRRRRGRFREVMGKISRERSRPARCCRGVIQPIGVLMEYILPDTYCVGDHLRSNFIHFSWVPISF
jgi:hypothetical protein